MSDQARERAAQLACEIYELRGHPELQTNAILGFQSSVAQACYEKAEQVLSQNIGLIPFGETKETQLETRVATLIRIRDEIRVALAGSPDPPQCTCVAGVHMRGTASTSWIEDCPVHGSHAPAMERHDQLEALRVAKQVVDEWTVDSTGRVNVHKDAISKAINAAIWSVERREAEIRASEAEYSMLHQDTEIAPNVRAHKEEYCPKCRRLAELSKEVGR